MRSHIGSFQSFPIARSRNSPRRCVPSHPAAGHGRSWQGKDPNILGVFGVEYIAMNMNMCVIYMAIYVKIGVIGSMFMVD